MALARHVRLVHAEVSVEVSLSRSFPLVSRRRLRRGRDLRRTGPHVRAKTTRRGRRAVTDEQRWRRSGGVLTSGRGAGRPGRRRGRSRGVRRRSWPSPSFCCCRRRRDSRAQDAAHRASRGAAWRSSAHMMDATVRRRADHAVRAGDVDYGLALLVWAVLTIPFSYWPGGSVALLTDQYLKAVVFFWLIAAIVTTRERLRTFALGARASARSRSRSPRCCTSRSGVYCHDTGRRIKRIAGYRRAHRESQRSGADAEPVDPVYGRAAVHVSRRPGSSGRGRTRCCSASRP